MKMPGSLYSALLALGAWATAYFSTGEGSGWMYAPILLSTIPIIIKALTVQQPEQPTPQSDSEATARGIRVEPESKMRKFILG